MVNCPPKKLRKLPQKLRLVFIYIRRCIQKYTESLQNPWWNSLQLIIKRLNVVQNTVSTFLFLETFNLTKQSIYSRTLRSICQILCWITSHLIGFHIVPSKWCIPKINPIFPIVAGFSIEQLIQALRCKLRSWRIQYWDTSSSSPEIRLD